MANAFYAQSGGVTAVINTQAAALIEAFRQQNQLKTLYAGQNGILGLLEERLIDTQTLSPDELSKLFHTPGGVFGSCRYKMKRDADCQRAIEVMRAHDIEVFFYNGGNDSQDTTHRLAQMAKAMHVPLTCIGLPKTIDNDLSQTDTCPGFGSVAKYVATSTLEATLDVRAMAKTSTKVFILEVMGRHAGWIAAASALAQHPNCQTPHLILLPEVPFNDQTFLASVKATVEAQGFCVIVASEGIRDQAGQFLSESTNKDAFGHAQLGGVAPILSGRIQQSLGFKTHWAVCDYLQRSARHIASEVDVLQAKALSQRAIEYALAGKSDLMLTIERLSDAPYTWQVNDTPLESVANLERTFPKTWIREDGFHITEEARQYLQAYIIGEAYPSYHQGVPDYLCRDFEIVQRRCAPFKP